MSEIHGVPSVTHGAGGTERKIGAARAAPKDGPDE